MTKKIKTPLLRPYAAFLLYECRAQSNGKGFSLADVAKALKNSLIGTLAGANVEAEAAWPANPNTNCLAVHFSKTTQAAWTTDRKIQDVAQHLIVLVEHASHVGIAMTDGDIRDRVAKILHARGDLAALPADVLENALVRDRELLTLWLSATHRSSPYKADSKVLIGKHLQSALNPLDDRTFRASSARAATDSKAAAAGVSRIGVSPKKSYVWLGPTNGLTNFVGRFEALIDYISTRRRQTYQPVPVLARSLQNAPAPGSVRDAFDFSFASHLSLGSVDQATKGLLEAFELELEITTQGNAADQNFELLVLDSTSNNTSRSDGHWRVEVTIALNTAGVTAALAGDSQGWPQWANKFETLMSDSLLWSVWYETGEALSAGEWIRLDVRASSYDGTILGVSFGANWELHKEKPQVGTGPVNWSKVGTDKSLFSWWLQQGMATCFKNVKGLASGEFVYLICDDGSNEFADFVILAKHQSFRTKTNPSDLALVMVHIKGASKAKTRQMAPKKYEEVLEQSTKALGRASFPDATNYLLDRLTDGKAMLWEWDGSRFQLLLLRGAKLPSSHAVRNTWSAFNGQRVHAEVIVLQPHQGKSSFEAEMGNAIVDFRTQMMCTMLCAADGAARASSANFRVIMSA